jgi:outer membrane receptor protein involved in Fe transport
MTQAGLPAAHDLAVGETEDPAIGYNFLVRIGLVFLFVLIGGSVSAQTLTGVVVDGNGNAISGAEVTLIDPKSSAVNTVTDADGSFSLSGQITAGSRLTVSSRGFATFERKLENDGVRDFTVVLQPSRVTADVTVSVTRTETRLNETPASVVVLSRNQLDSTAAQTMDDSLRQVAGFTLFRRSSSKTANPTTHGANLRGVSGSGASRAAVMFDGLSLNDAFGGWTYWSRVPQIAVEQAEVLRGGASSLYGSGGLSGAVNLTPARVENDKRIIRFQTSGGTQETFDGGVFAAYSHNGWGFDLAAETFRTDGYIPIAEDERGAVDTNANSKHNNAIAGVERRFGNSPQRDTEKAFSGRMFFRANLFSEDRENGTSLTNNATYFRQASVGGDLVGETFGRFEVRAFLQSQVYDQTFSSVSSDRNTETLTRIQRVPSQATGANLFWTRAFGEHTPFASFEFREARGFSDETGFAGGVATSLSGAGGHERTAAFFAQDVWRATKRLTISVGARYDRWRNYDAHSTTRILAANSTTTTLFPDRTDRAFSPRVAAIFSANEQISFYGSYSRSFRAPTLNELYRAFRVGNVITQSNENLRAETADTFEGGVSFNAFQNRLALRSNVFVTTVSDPVVSVTLSSTPALITRQRQNVGETRSRGVEVDAEFAPIPELKLSAGYILVDARVTEFSANPSLIGKYLPQVARQQFNFQINYRPHSRWSFGVQTRITSGQFEDDLNTLLLRPYITVDATAAFHIRENMEIFAAAENVFNNRYDIGLTPNRTVAAPAFVRGGLRFNLGKR